ncbi:MAG: hypothetical protein GC137_00960 [Alphaproteobacteria bacterium]|nr:hypothetical protein [Alphaproteobacteria bacterium]
MKAVRIGDRVSAREGITGGVEFIGIFQGIASEHYAEDGTFLGCKANVLDDSNPKYPELKVAVAWEPI